MMAKDKSSDIWWTTRPKTEMSHYFCARGMRDLATTRGNCPRPQYRHERSIHVAVGNIYKVTVSQKWKRNAIFPGGCKTLTDAASVSIDKMLL